MLSKLTNISNSKSLSGIPLFNDDSRTMMKPGSPQALLRAEYLSKIYVSAVQIHVVFFSKVKEISNTITAFVNLSPANELRLVDTTSRTEYSLDVKCYRDNNSLISDYSGENGSQNFKLNLNVLKIEKFTDADIRPGKEAAMIWIGTLAVSCFALARAFINDVCITERKS